MIFDDKKVAEVIGECYRRMYKETEPVGDIDEIKKSGEGKMEGFFMAYYLEQDRQDEITKEVIKEFKVPTIQQTMIINSVVLGASPCGNKETSKASRLTHDRRLKEHLKKLKDAHSEEKPKVVILDDNELSLSKYAEEYPENFEEISNAVSENSLHEKQVQSEVTRK